MKPLLPIALFLLPVILHAQPSDDDANLYIPPTLALIGGEGMSVAVDSYTQVIRRRTPLLPMLFFDQGAWDIPERYRRFSGPGEAADFTDTGTVYYHAGKRGKYHEILNIVGYRMSRDTTTTLSLRGCYSFEPGEDAPLAYERALVVREYLHAVWGVDTARLPILPPRRPVISDASLPLQEEGRRVEFITEDRHLLRPVDFSWTSTAPIDIYIPLLLTLNASPADVASIEFRILDDRRELLAAATLQPDPTRDVYELDVEWWYSLRDGADLADNLQLEARLIMTDGRIRSAGSIPMKRIRSSDFITHPDPINPGDYGIIPFFAWGESGLSDLQKDVIREYVRLCDSLNAAAGRDGLLAVAKGVSASDEGGLWLPEEIDAVYLAEKGGRSAPDGSSSEEHTNLQVRIVGTEDEPDPVDPLPWMSIYGEVTEATTYNPPPPRSTSPPSPVVLPESPSDVDSLGLDRARSVITFLRDSLGVEIPELDVQEAISGQPASRREWLEYARGRGIHPLESQYRRMEILPEDRYYQRSVTLTIEPVSLFLRR